MTGIQHIVIKNRDAHFKFDLVRNITIVRGKSGTGKTTLFDMVADYTRLGENSGVNISSDKKCVALIDIDWRNQLNNTSDSIVFIDEGAEFLRTVEFAEMVESSDNYYVIFNRESLHNLPYSVDEIYEIRTRGKKYHTFKKLFQSTDKHIYNKSKINNDFSVLLTEDSNSGFQFYSHYFKDSDVSCVSSEGNSNIFSWLKKHIDEKIFIVADGAAFGAEIDRVLKLSNDNILLCLPESFEWLVLKSDIIRNNNIKAILENPSEYIESSEFFSWEKFFTHYLIEISQNTPFNYFKKEINTTYLNEINSKKIIAEILD